MVMERRNLKLELRAADDVSGMQTIAGHAAVFNQMSSDLGGWFEIMHPGAFANSIEVDDIRALWNHDMNWVLGRNKAGTLRLEEDAVGLAIEVDPPEAQWARDLVESIRRGDVDQMSIGFWTQRDEWRMEGTMVVRDVYEVKLFDVSPVTAAAYPQTDVGLRLDELSELSTRMKAGQASAAEMTRLNEMLEALNQRGHQAGPAGEAHAREGLGMRQRLLKMISGTDQ